MKKFTKIILIIASSLIGTGLILSIIGFVAGGNANVSFSQGKFKTVEKYQYSSEEFSDIAKIVVNVSNAKVNFVKSNNNSFKVDINYNSCLEKPEVKINEKELSIIDKGSNWKDFAFNFSFLKIGDIISSDGNSVTVYIPENALLDMVKVDTSNGEINSNAAFKVQKINYSSSNGKIIADKITVLEDTQFKTSNGNIECEGMFSENIYIKTSNGEITASGAYNGDVECKTSNGSISFKTSNGEKDYNIDADTSNGKVEINGIKYDHEYSMDNNASFELILKSSNSNISADFTK